MAQPPNVFNDATVLRTALYDLLANDAALFSQIAEAVISATEWLANSWTPVYASASTFTVQADQTAQYIVGRAARVHQDGGYSVGYVTSASFSAGTGLTTVELSGATLDASLDEVNLGIISPGGASPDTMASKAWSQALVYTRPRLITSWRAHDTDLYPPESAGLGATAVITLAHGARRRVMLQERVMQPGLGLRLALLLAMSSTAAANLALNWAYRVVSPGEALGLAVDFWQAGKAYVAGAQVIGLAADGWRVFTAIGGPSGANEPAWPSVGTVADNGWNWSAGAVVYKHLSLSFTVTVGAGQGFWVDSSSLQIPAAELTSQDQLVVGFLWVPAASPHPGDMHLLDAWLQAVEV